MTPAPHRRMVRQLGLAILMGLALAVPTSADIPDKFTNLKVLPKEISKEDLTTTMRGFSSALGVRCNYCHVRPEGNPQADFDWPSDKKAEKETARVMLRMLARINTKELPQITTGHPDRVEVECRTCHRGQARPRLIEDILAACYHADGIDSLAATYQSMRKEYYGTDTFDFGEGMLPSLGERLTGRDKPDQMMKFAELNLHWYPQSGYAYMVRGQTKARLGDKEGAIQDLSKAVELDPDLKENVGRVLERLKSR